MAWCAQLPAGCLIAMEASSSAHDWARKLVALANKNSLIQWAVFMRGKAFDANHVSVTPVPIPMAAPITAMLTVPA